MTRFEPAEEGLRRTLDAMAVRADQISNEVLAEVSATHAGDTEDGVKAALKAALLKRGIDVDPPADMVRQILEAKDPADG